MGEAIVYKPGEIYREVERWETIQGNPMVIRNMVATRTKRPLPSWTGDVQAEYELLLDRFSTIKHKKGFAVGARKKSLEEEYKEVKKEKDRMYKRREVLTTWENEQIRRCYNGHRTFSGFHYFYFQFGWIQSIDLKSRTKKNHRPNYRSCDDWVSRILLKSVGESRGNIIVKRRRIGMSWIAAAFCAYQIVFHNAAILFVSKDKTDCEKFLERVVYFHNKLPDFLQCKFDRDAIHFKSFFPSRTIAQYNKEKVEDLPKGFINAVSPQNIEAAAGDTLSLIIVDEAGEIPNLRGVLDKGLPALNGPDGLTRAGAAILFGTVGNMETAGAVMKNVWDGHNAFEVDRVFMPGWMGTILDEYGNEDKKAAIARIKEKIEDYESAGLLAEAIAMRQKYPLTIKDAFMGNPSGKLWPLDKIELAEDAFKSEPPKVQYGIFYRKTNGEVAFKEQEPNPSRWPGEPDYVGNLQIQILEHPKPSLWETPYVAGSDPIDQDKDQYNESQVKGKKYIPSDFSFLIYKRAENIGEKSEYPVCYYHGRGDLSECFDQAIMACEYYGCKINIERNRGHSMEMYFRDKSKEHLIAYGAGTAMGIDTNDRVWGFNNSEKWWVTMIRLGKKWWNENYNKPMIYRMINESRFVRERNTDLLIAFLAALQYARELDLRENAGLKKYASEKREVEYTWNKVNGRFVAKGSQVARLDMLKKQRKIKQHNNRINSFTR